MRSFPESAWRGPRCRLAILLKSIDRMDVEWRRPNNAQIELCSQSKRSAPTAPPEAASQLHYRRRGQYAPVRGRTTCTTDCRDGDGAAANAKANTNLFVRAIPECQASIPAILRGSNLGWARFPYVSCLTHLAFKRNRLRGLFGLRRHRRLVSRRISLSRLMGRRCTAVPIAAVARISAARAGECRLHLTIAARIIDLMIGYSKIKPAKKRP